MDSSELGGTAALVVALGWSLKKLIEQLGKWVETRAEAARTMANAEKTRAEARRAAADAARVEADTHRSMQDTMQVRYDRLEHTCSELRRQLDESEMALSEQRKASDMALWAAMQHEERARHLEKWILSKGMKPPIPLVKDLPPVVPPPSFPRPVTDLIPTIPAIPALPEAASSDEDRDTPPSGTRPRPKG